jgi:hypothetical protein
MKKYLCKNCAKNNDDKRIILPGIELRCAECGLYPFTYYEKKGDKWLPTVSFDVLN